VVSDYSPLDMATPLSIYLARWLLLHSNSWRPNARAPRKRASSAASDSDDYTQTTVDRLMNQFAGKRKKKKIYGANTLYTRSS
jgi:hypothetical protein